MLNDKNQTKQQQKSLFSREFHFHSANVDTLLFDNCLKRKAKGIVYAYNNDDGPIYLSIEYMVNNVKSRVHRIILIGQRYVK